MNTDYPTMIILGIIRERRIHTGVWYFINVYFYKASESIFLHKSKTVAIIWCENGKGVVIKPKVNIKYPWRLEVGNYTWIGENAWIDRFGKCKIGNNVCISQGAMLLAEITITRKLL